MSGRAKSAPRKKAGGHGKRWACKVLGDQWLPNNVKGRKPRVGGWLRRGSAFLRIDEVVEIPRGQA